MWRPKNWKNPYKNIPVIIPGDGNPPGVVASDAFENGADAMLEAIFGYESKLTDKEKLSYQYVPCYGGHGNMGKAIGECPLCHNLLFEVTDKKLRGGKVVNK